MIQTLMDADDKLYEAEMQENYEAQRWWQAHPRLYAIHDWLWMLYGKTVERTICKWRGHDLVDDGSYSNPDSGGEGQRCIRCGQSWWHQYY